MADLVDQITSGLKAALSSSLGSYLGYTLCSFPLTWTQPVAQEALYTLVTKCWVVAAVCQLNAHCFKIMVHVLVDLIEHGKIQHGHEPSWKLLEITVQEARYGNIWTTSESLPESLEEQPRENLRNDARANSLQQNSERLLVVRDVTCCITIYSKQWSGFGVHQFAPRQRQEFRGKDEYISKVNIT